jgi:hypothetical protein
METTWHYLSNQFLSVTKTSFKKTLKLSNYHEAMLKKAMVDQPLDGDWALLHGRYLPLHSAYVATYNQWKREGGQKKSESLNVKQLLAQLPAKINRWDVLVQLQYGKSTPAYKAIFPQGRKPFNRGGKTANINALGVLSKNMEGDPALAAIKSDVDLVFSQMKNAQNAQHSAKGATKSKSEKTHEARVAAMKMQHQNLGFLINKIPDSNQTIASFFELSLLRRHNQVIFKGQLKASATKAVLTHTFVEDDKLALQVNGPGPISFYLGSRPLATNSEPVILHSTQKTIITTVDFGIQDYGRHRYLTAVNPNLEKSTYVVEVLD